MKTRILLLLILILFLNGCATKQPEITPEEIVAAYQDAGYGVWFEMYDEKREEGEIGYIQANHPNGDYIYFAIYETEEEAIRDKEEYYHPIAMGLFSIIYGQPSWQRWEVHGNIGVQYDQSEFYEIFENLIKSK